jgi:hypothetical protein
VRSLDWVGTAKTRLFETTFVLAVPIQPKVRNEFLANEGRKVIIQYAVCSARYKNGSPTKSAKDLTKEDEEELSMILLAFSDIQGLTKETAEKIQLRRVLDVVLNRVGVQRTYQFPASAVRIAQNAFDRYEAQG